MSTAPPTASELPINKQITNDLKVAFKAILEKYLEGRTIKEDKIKSWMNDILTDAKEYFIKKYPQYDLFLDVYVYPRNVYFYSKLTSISMPNIDWSDLVEFTDDNSYSVLYFFFYEHVELNYKLEGYENTLIQKESETLRKYLEDRKFGEECKKYNEYINDDLTSFVLNEEKSAIRCFFLSEIYKNPIKSKYYYKYLSHGKQIHTKIIQAFNNDSLTCYHYLFFFK